MNEEAITTKEMFERGFWRIVLSIGDIKFFKHCIKIEHEKIHKLYGKK